MEAEEKKEVFVLPAARLQGGDFIRMVHCAHVADGISLEDVVKPEFWTMVEKKFRPNDHIEVYSDSNAYYAELLVISVGVHNVQTAVIRHVELDGSLPQAPGEPFGVRWAGGAKFRVIRKSDGKVMQEGIETKEAAYHWISDHMKALSR
jgi:hypothetical protein